MRRRTAIRCCWSAPATRSTRRSTTSSTSISSATSRRSRASCACRNVMVVHPSVPAKTVPEFIAYAKANPGKINMASAGNGTSPHVAGELFKMMTGVDMVARALSRRRRRRSPTCIGGQVQVMFDNTAVLDRAHQGRQAARAGGDDRDALGGAAGRARPWANSCRATRRARFGGIGAPKNTPRRDRRQAQQRRSMPRSPIPRLKARLADWAARAVPARPPNSASSSPRKPRSGPRWSSSPGAKAE